MTVSSSSFPSKPFPAPPSHFTLLTLPCFRIMTLSLSPFHPIFSLLLPRKLNSHFFSPALLQRTLLLAPLPIGPASFTTRSARDATSAAARAGSPKSLIEDEADLSDWVGGLKSSSFKKTRVYTDSDNDDDGRKSGGFDRLDGAGKRRRDSDFDRDSDLTSRRGGRGGGREFTQSSSGRRYNDNESSGSSFGGRSGRGGRGGRRELSEPFLGRRKYENESSGSFYSGRGRGRGSSNSSRGGKFGGLSEERRERTHGYLSKGDGERKQKGLSEKGLGMSYGNRGGRSGDRGGGLARNRGGKGMERRGFVVTDDEGMEDEDDDEGEVEEENEKGFTSFKELIDSDESDEDDTDDDDDVEEVEEDEEDEVVRAKPDKRRSSNELLKISSQSGDSYLSESR